MYGVSLRLDILYVPNNPLLQVVVVGQHYREFWQRFGGLVVLRVVETGKNRDVILRFVAFVLLVERRLQKTDQSLLDEFQVWPFPISGTGNALCDNMTDIKRLVILVL